MSEFDVVNVVGTVDFQRRIALTPLAESLADHIEVNKVDYDPAELHLIHSWFFNEEIYVAFYKNGTCSVTGIGSLEDFCDKSNRISDIVEKILDFDIEPSTKINNIVATAKIEDIPPLETIAIGLGLNKIEYEPEQFPALIYYGEKFVILVFPSGKLVCTGLTDIKQISSAIENVTMEINDIVVT